MTNDDRWHDTHVSPLPKSDRVKSEPKLQWTRATSEGSSVDRSLVPISCVTISGGWARNYMEIVRLLTTAWPNKITRARLARLNRLEPVAGNPDLNQHKVVLTKEWPQTKTWRKSEDIRIKTKQEKVTLDRENNNIVDVLFQWRAGQSDALLRVPMWLTMCSYRGYEGLPRTTYPVLNF